MKLQIGDTSPDFTTTASQIGQADRQFKLSAELQKGPVLLVFYPGDFTSVCTKQLCDYRDNWESLKKFNVQIVGVSTDPRESHEKFIAANNFPFSLLDDSTKEICKKFDMLMFVGLAKRGLVLIGKDGKISYYFNEVLPFFKRSASEVADVLRSAGA